MKLTHFFLLVTLAGLAVGCASVRPSSLMPFQSKEAKDAEDEIEYGVARSIAVVWVDSIYTEPGLPATKGFGGRFFFYDEDAHPVRVQGELTIYAFDDSGRYEAAEIPDRKFVFRQQEFQSHYAVSEFGPSYSFWIPWEAVGGPRKTISLLPLFKPVDGQVVRGEQSINVLPGRSPLRETESWVGPSRNGQTRPVSHLEPIGPGDTRQSLDGPLTQYNRTRLTTSTIRVPPSLERQLRHRSQRNPYGTDAPAPGSNQGAADGRIGALDPRSADLPITTPINRQGTGPVTDTNMPVPGQRPGTAQNSTTRQPFVPARTVFGQPGSLSGANSR